MGVLDWPLKKKIQYYTDFMLVIIVHKDVSKTLTCFILVKKKNSFSLQSKSLLFKEAGPWWNVASLNLSEM